MRAVNRDFTIGPLGNDANSGLATLLDSADRGLLQNGKPLAAQAVQHNSRQFGVILAQCLRALDHGNLRTQPQMGLRHLHADGASANHDEMPDLVAVLEQGLIGEIACLLQAGNGWNKGRGACCHDKAPCADLVFACRHSPGIGEFRCGADHRYAKRGEAFLRIIGFDCRDDRPNMVVDLAGINLEVGIGHDAKIRRLPYGLCMLGSGNQRLGRNAAIVEAITTHTALFDQNHGDAKGGGSSCHGKSAGACADNANIWSKYSCH